MSLRFDWDEDKAAQRSSVTLMMMTQFTLLAPVNSSHANAVNMKMPADNDDTIPNDVDFSRATRGKYRERYREGVTFRNYERVDPISLYEAQSRIGYAILRVQSLESAMVAYLALAWELALNDAGSETAVFLESGVRRRQTITCTDERRRAILTA